MPITRSQTGSSKPYTKGPPLPITAPPTPTRQPTARVASTSTPSRRRVASTSSRPNNTPTKSSRLAPTPKSKRSRKHSLPSVSRPATPEPESDDDEKFGNMVRGVLFPGHHEQTRPMIDISAFPDLPRGRTLSGLPPLPPPPVLPPPPPGYPTGPPRWYATDPAPPIYVPDGGILDYATHPTSVLQRGFQGAPRMPAPPPSRQPSYSVLMNEVFDMKSAAMSPALSQRSLSRQPTLTSFGNQQVGGSSGAAHFRRD